MKQERWKLVDAHLQMRREMLWGFHLTLQRPAPPGAPETQEVRVWVEHTEEAKLGPYQIWRSLQTHQEGQLHTLPVSNVLFQHLVLEQEVHPRVRELLYLWTRDIEVVPQLQPLVEHNLHELRKKGARQYGVADASLASARVYLYDVVEATGSGLSEASIYRGRATTWDELRQIVLELPSKAYSFEVHFEVQQRIVGNADYRVEHELDPATGKRQHLYVECEFGVCEGLHRYFADLYDTDEEYEQFIDRLV